MLSDGIENVSYGLAKVLYGLEKVLDGLKKVTDFLKNVSYYLRRHPDGLGKVLDVHKTFIIVAESLQILPHIDLDFSVDYFCQLGCSDFWTLSGFADEA